MLVLESVSAGAAPVPASATVCGEPVALSATLNVARKLPVVFGVNLTDMLQLLPAVRVVPQVLVSVNAEEAVPPPMEMAMPVKVALPGFESVTVWTLAELPTLVGAKVSDVGESTAWAVGTGAAEAPLKATVWVAPLLPPLLSVTVKVAE
jgi:hypothetical protein